MTDDLIAEARRVAEAATKAPWEVTTGPHIGLRYSVIAGGEVLCTLNEWSPDVDKADAEFIAAARTLVPQLADRCEQLQKRVEALEAALRPFVDVLFIGPTVPDHGTFEIVVKATAKELRAARAALAPDGEGG